MAVPLGLSDMEEVFQLAMKDIEFFKAEVKQRPETVQGVKRASDAELVAMVNKKVATEYPPEVLISPDGKQYMASAFLTLLGLPTTEGGNEDMKRLIEIVNNGGIQ